MKKIVRNANSIMIIAIVFIAVALVIPAFCQDAAKQDTKQEAQYVGSQKCKGCHSLPKTGEQYKSWAETKMAKSMDSLKAKGEDKNEKCLACHTTGFGKPHADDAKLDEIGCEACHGPASEWKSIHQKNKDEAIAKGMIVKPTEEVCVKCHNKNSPNFKGFNYAEYVKKGVHKIKEPAK
jgi:hypothetical protein